MTDQFILSRHKIFVSKARQACQQSLYFLNMLYKTNWGRATGEVDQYSLFALHQIKSLISGVYIPKQRQQIQQEIDKSQDLDENLKAKYENAIDLCKDWKDLANFLENNLQLQLEEISKLRKKILNVLEKSKADTVWNFFYHQFFKDFLYYLRKKIALFWAIALLIFAFKTEAIWGLLRNEGWYVLFPFIFAFLPLIVNRIVIFYLFKKNATVAFWDIGGRALRSLFPLAVEPGKLVDRWSAKSPLLGYILWSQVGRLIVYVLWWMITILIIKDTGGTLRTIYAFLSIGCLILTLANLIDLWDYLSKAPFRFLVLLAATIFIILSITGSSRLVIILYFLGLALICFFVWLKSRRKTNLVSLIAMLLFAIVAFFGGLTQNKEIWQKQEEKTIQQQLPKRITQSEWPHNSGNNDPVVVMAASGGGSRAAVFAGLTLRRMNEDSDLRKVIVNLQAISSVSGGSLANAAYIARLVSVFEKLGQNEYSSSRQDAFKDLDKALSSDFLWPTLTGMFKLKKSRGKSIEEEWERGDVNLGELRLGDLIEKWRDARSQKSKFPPFPIPLFNTSSLEGHDVVISPLSKELYTNAKLHEHASSDENYYTGIRKLVPNKSDNPTWVFYRNGIYGLENLLAHFNPLLSSAVRASANFPFGFPLVKVKPDPEKVLYFSHTQEHDIVSLTDGGALSNSGMWSLFQLLMNNKPGLQGRGVLLIIVDAGKMPEYRNLDKSLNALVGTIQDQSTIGQNMHRMMYDLLEKQYGNRIGIVKFDLIELDHYNVMTTWALDNDSLDKLHESFDKRWEEKRAEIISKWSKLQSNASDETIQPIDRRRPPMD
jgi:hypothetical protein